MHYKRRCTPIMKNDIPVTTKDSYDILTAILLLTGWGEIEISQYRFTISNDEMYEQFIG